MGELATPVRMPVTAVSLNDFSKGMKRRGLDNPGESAQEAVSVAHTVNELADSHLWRCILASDSPHVLAPAFRRNHSHELVRERLRGMYSGDKLSAGAL